MRAIKETLETWPHNSNEEPIFRTTNDAIFYAQLASRDVNQVSLMKLWRKKAFKDLHNARSVLHPNLDNLMQYAVKAQFFRECFMEILRIQDEEK